MWLVIAVGGFWAEPDEVDDFKDAARIDDENRDKPPHLIVASGVPESIALDSEYPDYEKEEESERHKHESGRQRKIQ